MSHSSYQIRYPVADRDFTIPTDFIILKANSSLLLRHITSRNVLI